MRSLTLNETHAISGAGFSEDITATAATIIVGGTIGGVAAGASKAIFSTLTLLSFGLAPVASAIGTIGSIITPLSAVAVPLAVGGLVLQSHPEYQDALAQKYHHYFG